MKPYEPTIKMVTLTADQLREIVADTVRQTIEELGASERKVTAEKPEREYVHGLRGIMGLFNVCAVTAQRYKNTWLQPAVTQRGRKFIVDVDMARRLFSEQAAAV